MNKLLKYCTVLSLAMGIGVAQADKIPVVAITQIVAHPALDATHKGVVDRLAEAGFKDGESVKIIHETAQGDVSIAAQIAKKFAGEQPDVIVPIATPSAQTVASAARGIPIVFAAVTDPLEAKLVSNLDKPGKNITGVRDEVDFARHLEMILQITPDTLRIGTVYNPGEANSVATVAKVEQYLKDKPQELVTAAATKTSEVLGAARSLVGKVDVIYITLDNTVVSAMEAVVQVGEQNKIPVFNADTDSVSRGSVAALGFEYYDVGMLAGDYVVQILNGKNPGDIPVGSPKEVKLVVNLVAAEKMGVTLTQAVIESASKVIGQE